MVLLHFVGASKPNRKLVRVDLVSLQASQSNVRGCSQSSPGLLHLSLQIVKIGQVSELHELHRIKA